MQSSQENFAKSAVTGRAEKDGSQAAPAAPFYGNRAQRKQPGLPTGKKPSLWPCLLTQPWLASKREQACIEINAAWAFRHSTHCIAHKLPLIELM